MTQPRITLCVHLLLQGRCMCNLDRWVLTALPQSRGRVSNNLSNALCLLPVIKNYQQLWSKASPVEFLSTLKKTIRGKVRVVWTIQGVKEHEMQSNSKQAVTWKRCFCRGPGRPLFQTPTPRFCSPRCWRCRCHFSGICSCNGPRLKEKHQISPRLARVGLCPPF